MRTLPDLRSTLRSLPTAKPGQKSYGKTHKAVCEALHLTEVYMPMVYRRSVCEDGKGGVLDVRYGPSGEKYLVTHDGRREHVGKARFERVSYQGRKNALRRSKIIYLSHVLTEYGSCERAERPIHRLLRHAYNMAVTNLRKLVNMIIVLCRSSEVRDKTRYSSEPAKGLRKIPGLLPDPLEKPLVIEGICFPRWKQSWVSTRK